jgi:hypothetical protein
MDHVEAIGLVLIIRKEISFALSVVGQLDFETVFKERSSLTAIAITVVAPTILVTVVEHRGYRCGVG